MKRNEGFPVWLVAAVAVVLLSAGVAYKARGLRNKNPGNIRAGDSWRGMIGTDDAGFVIFSHARWGIRAMQRILNSYRRQGITTLTDIVHRWAPPNENNTPAYLEHVANVTDQEPGAVFPPEKDGLLIAAIIKHENGLQPYSMDLIDEGRALA